MPPKRFQRSRLNSLAEATDLRLLKMVECAGCTPPIIRTIAKVNKIKKKYLDATESEIEIFNYEEGIYEEEEASESPTEVKQALTRTSLLILDHRQFIAARCIQRFVRGWLATNRYGKQRRACIVIQAEWRRFYGQRCYYQKLENLVQEKIQKHYCLASVKIQAAWRGWWVREHIHDHKLLVRMQVMAGEDLLHCVAFKLHHLLRTHQIPGIYSLRNSNAFSKVEKLLASLSFKHCIPPVIKAREFREGQYRDAKNMFKDSAFATQVPFEGPNIENLCVPQCMQLFSLKDADRKMAQILSMYEQATRIHPKLKKRHKQSTTKYRNICKPPSSTFCGDVVRSMKKWKIIEENKKEIDPNIFQRPENVENFLKEIKSSWSLLHGNCNCRLEHVEKTSRKNLKISEKCLRI